MNRTIKEITKYDRDKNMYWFDSGHVAIWHECRNQWSIGLGDWGNMKLNPGGKRYTAAVKKIEKHQKLINHSK